MSSADRGASDATGRPPVYTVYPGVCRGSENYGFHFGHPRTPPPNYEDVVSGRPTERMPPPLGHGAYESSEPVATIFVAPAYKYSRAQKVAGFIFLLLFFVFAISIVIKILRVH